MVITFSNIKGSGGGGGATGGTVSGITLWSGEYTQEYIDSAVTEAMTAYTKTEDFATINGSAITSGGDIEIQGAVYSAGTNINIDENNVISVTGITVPTDISDLNDDIGIATTAWTNSAITDATSGLATTTYVDDAVSGKMDTSAMSAYTPTSGFSTINGSAITSGDNLVIEGTPYSGGTGIGVENHIISVTGDYETVVELTQAEYDALTAYSENTTYIITDAPAINMSAYTPTSGFSTINGSAITTGDAIVIETGGNYSAGTNIDITNDVISVTGITVPTKTSDLVNDSGFITQSDIPTSNTAFTNDAGYVNSGEVETQITSKDYPTKNWVQGHVTLAISGKLDTDVFTAYTASTDTVLQNKVDTSAMTQYATTAFTEATYLKEHQSLSAYSTTEEMNSAISGAISSVKTEIEAEIPTKVSDLQNDLNFVDSGDVKTQIEGYNYINSGQAQTQIDNALTAYTPTSGLPTSNTAFTNDAGYVNSGDVKTQVEAYNYVDSGDVQTQINESISGKADTTAVTAAISTATAATTGWVSEQGYLTEHQSLSAYSTTVEVEEMISGFTTSADVKTQIEGYNYITSGDAQTQIENSISGKVDTSAMTQYYTSAETNTAISNATSGLATEQYVDNSVSGKADTSALTEYWTSAETESAITAATDDMATQTWVGQQGYLTAFTETDPVFQASAASGITSGDINNWNNKLDSSALTPYYTSGETNTAINNAVSGKADADAFSAYTPTSGFSTINGSAITDGSAIVIQTGGNYSAGNNIDISNNTISVTGITSYTGITSGDITTALGYTPISGVDLTDYYTSAQTDTAIANATSGKVDTSAMTAYWTSAETESAITAATEDFVTSAQVNTQIEGKGYITGYTESDPVFMASPASGITSQDITNWDAKLDASALTETNNHIDNMEEMTATALIELKNTKADTTALTEYAKAEHVAELEQVTSAALNNLAENKADSSAVTASIASATAATTGWVENQGYLTAYTETDPVFMSSPASGISVQDITNWNNKLDASGLTPYYTSAQTDTAISNAVSGLASEEYVDNAVSGKVDTSALTETNNHIDNMEEMTAIALMDLKNTKADTTALTEYAKSEHLGEVEQVTSVALNNLETNKVGSTDVHNMVVVTQAQYNALTPDPNTFYIIVG